MLNFDCAQIPLDGILPFCCVNCTIQIGIIVKLAEGTLHPSDFVVDKDVEEQWSQEGPLGNSTRDWHPPGHRAIENNPLAMATQTIICPPNSPVFKSIPLKFREQDMAWDHIKGFAEFQVGNTSHHSFVH